MPLSDQFLSSEGIRNVSRKIFADNIFLPMKTENQWKVLVVDDFGMKILTACFNTEEVMSFNIALIENISDTRESVPYLAAIYFICPSVQNIGYLTVDLLSSPPKYLRFHLFFLAAVPPDLFEELLKYAIPGTVTIFKEMDYLFLAHESQVFSLNDERFFSIFYDAFLDLDLNYCSFIAMKLTTLCGTLHMRPNIRYRRTFVKNLIVADALNREFDRQLGKSSMSTLDANDSNPRCEILILDRGFDSVSPVIHEFSMQAMLYDLLEIEEDIYKYADKEDGETTNQFPLTETDSLWRKLRHLHIAQVSKTIDEYINTNRLVRHHSKMARYRKLPELGEVVKKQLASKEYQRHLIYKRMANECVKKYCEGVNLLVEAEQEFAMALISGQEVKDPKALLMNILNTDGYTLRDKLRVLILYIFYCNGITKQEFDSIIQLSNLPYNEARLITNVLHLDVDIFRPGFCKAVVYETRKSDPSTSIFNPTRWVPALKNIIIKCIEGSLSEEVYPYLKRAKKNSVLAYRTGFWCRDKLGKYMSRLIVFIAGGVTYSEMRTVYEVMEQYKGWEIYIGSDSLLTPQKYLDKLMNLRCFINEQ